MTPKTTTTLSPLAIERLRTIKHLILEEPKRIHMESAVIPVAARGGYLGAAAFPACNTVGCIAGWGAIMDSLLKYYGEIERIWSPDIIYEKSQELYAAMDTGVFIPGAHSFTTGGWDLVIHYASEYFDNVPLSILEKLFHLRYWPLRFLCTQFAAEMNRAAIDTTWRPTDRSPLYSQETGEYYTAGTEGYAKVVGDRIEHFIATDGAQ